MLENDISYLIRKAIFKVFNSLGPGLFESIYVRAMVFELNKLGLSAKTEVGIPLIYEEVRFDAGYRADVIVNDKVIVEVKSVENLTEVHHKQLLSYLRLSGLKLGLLVNFNTAEISKSIFRKVNNL
ncbi:MAG TPA: GxxExxY protein [Chitinophagaceae bacterium]|nr:GxxExxY protein [Chitinophagaceae bacterium]